MGLEDFRPDQNGRAPDGGPWDDNPLEGWQPPQQQDEFYTRAETAGRIFSQPQDDLKTEFLFVAEHLQAPYFLRLWPCFVRVYDAPEDTDDRPRPLRNEPRVYLRPSFGWGW